MDKPFSKKVLISTIHFAPAYKAGGIVRSLENLVRNFEDEFEFWVLSSNMNPVKTQLLTGVVQDAWVPYANNSKVQYVSWKNLRIKKIKEIILSSQPEVVYINGLFSVPFSIMPLLISRGSRSKPVIILAPCGMLHKGNLLMKPLKKKVFLALFRLLGFHKNIRWHATDSQEAKDIIDMFGTRIDVTVANVVPNLVARPLQPISKKKGELKLVTISLITPNKGHLRLLNTLKELENEISVEYHIYGPIKDNKFWEACEEQIKTLGSSIKVVYHGFLDPSQVEDTLRLSHFFILPTQGENFCQAAYESFNAGRPVIISDQTPWRELAQQRAGWDLDLHDGQSLANTLREAYQMDQATFDNYCLGAQGVAQRYVREADFAGQYERLFSE